MAAQNNSVEVQVQVGLGTLESPCWLTAREMQIILLGLGGLILTIILRVYYILPRKTTRRSHPELPGTRKLAVFLGSGKRSSQGSPGIVLTFNLGGHTSEALTMVSALDFRRYSPRIYIVSEGDTLSAKKAMALEDLKIPTSSLEPVWSI